MIRTLALLIAAAAVRGETLDRIAVTVEKRIITEGDIIRDLRVAAFADGKPVDLSAASKRQAAERLVEQILILQEAADSHLMLSSEDDVPKLLEAAKAPYGGDAEYHAALKRYQITEKDLAAHLLDHLRALRFSDLRFHPDSQITEKDLHDLYDKYASDWQNSKAGHMPTFEESREQLESLLTGQRAIEALDQWLVMERAQKQIEYRDEVFKDEVFK